MSGNKRQHETCIEDLFEHKCSMSKRCKTEAEECPQGETPQECCIRAQQLNEELVHARHVIGVLVGQIVVMNQKMRQIKGAR